MFYSQCGQDRFLNDNIFKGFKKGVFIDVGAHDGKTFNNTLFFEEQHEWTGINIEPNELVYKSLLKNRPSCININCAIDSKEGTAEFILNTGRTEMLSGLKSYYDPRHLNRCSREITEYGGTTTTVEINTLRLDTIFDRHNIKNVNYLSIDVEGGEFAVINSIDFQRVFIDIIEFENNFAGSSNHIIDYLVSKGYRVLKSDDNITMIHNKSLFN